MDFALISALTMVNLLLWLVFLVRFKRLFSADDIMTKFRDGMENLLKDAERDTALNINVIDEKIRESKAIVAEAERKLAILRHELNSYEKSAALQAQINLTGAAALASEDELPQRGATKRGRGKAALSAASKPALSAASKASSAPASKTASSSKSSSRAARAYKQNELPGEDEAYALTGLFKENAQSSLFDAPQITVTQDGDAYGKIPVLKTRAEDGGRRAAKTAVFASANPIKPKKSFASRVRELSELGKTVEEIASATEHSTTEVQLVLDMS